MINKTLLTWVPLALYNAAALPQFLTSLRSRSAAGVSQAMIYLRLTAVAFYIVYAYSCGLSMAYRVLMPLYFCMLGSLAVQGYMYDVHGRLRQLMHWGYAISAVMVTVMAVAAVNAPWRVGMISGWLAIAAYSVCEIPQAYRNYVRKSLKGFSFTFASLLALGAFIEACLVIALGMPKPTMASSIRILTFFSIYCFQGWLYRDKASDITCK